MPSEVQILKESKARFEGVIFKQEADLGTNKSTSCKVIDEATGNVIAESGGGGGDSESPFKEATITLKSNNSVNTTSYNIVFVNPQEITVGFAWTDEEGINSTGLEGAFTGTETVEKSVYIHDTDYISLFAIGPTDITFAITGDAETATETNPETSAEVTFVKISGTCEITITY